MTVITKMAELQNALNEYITPNWKETRTQLDWEIATTLEVAELIDSLPWKWWKGANGGKTTNKVEWEKLDEKAFANVKIELTDLIFFTLSGMANGTKETSIDSLDDNDYVNFRNIAKFAMNEDFASAATTTMLSASKIGFELAPYYCAKYTLNYIRQLQDYGTTYKKVVDGIEDNELLHDAIEGLSNTDFEKDFAGFADLVFERVYDTFKIPADQRKGYSDWIK